MLKHISASYETLFNKEISVCGWILTCRSQQKITFISITDGSHVDPLQIIYEGSLQHFKIGMSIRVVGTLVKSPAKGQLYEVQSSDISILGDVDPDYPISKTKLTLEYLRDMPHLRARTKTFACVNRIRHSMMMATHQFFDQEGFLLLDPNIITVNECEGGAGVFQVTENDISIPENLKLVPKAKNYDWSNDHFGKPAYLTVSSQLQLEAIALSMGKVYTTNKSFRSEHSTTHKHVSEFSHLEIEQCFTDLNDLISVGERYIKHVMKYVFEKNKKDLETLENTAKFISGIDKDLMKRYSISEEPFEKITYKNAVALLKENGKEIQYGQDLSSDDEKFLTDYFKKPVFMTHWDISIKSFYMKQCDDGTCESFDLLMPHVGELIGASQREDDYQKLESMMKKKGIDPKPLQFYLDLRKYGSVPHGGFGLGLDRFLMFLTGVHNIKDVIPFPVYYKNCNY